MSRALRSGALAALGAACLILAAAVFPTAAGAHPTREPFSPYRVTTYWATGAPISITPVDADSPGVFDTIQRYLGSELPDCLPDGPAWVQSDVDSIESQADEDLLNELKANGLGLVNGSPADSSIVVSWGFTLVEGCSKPTDPPPSDSPTPSAAPSDAPSEPAANPVDSPTPTATAVVAPPGPTSSPSAAAPAADEQLAYTGANTSPTLVAAGMLALGLLLLLLARRGGAR